MRRIVFGLVAVGALAGVVAYMAPASGQGDGEAAPIFGVKIPPGYREWRLISVAHEEGNLNDLRAILGNDVAIKDSRKYASTGGWGFAQFDDGKPADEAVHNTCFSCHETVKARDFVFNRYAP